MALKTDEEWVAGGSTNWRQEFISELMIGRRPIIAMLPMPTGPPVTGWRKIQVAWGWWAWRHETLLYLLRPWRWDWANWPFHSTAEYD